jgi:hypothetical protein
MIGLRIIAGIILSIWLLLVLLGKGSFVHLLLLSGIGIASVDLMCLVRRRVVERNE